MLALLDTDMYVSYNKKLLDKTAVKISVAGKNISLRLNRKF
jgi:hypothetical protein